MNTTRTLGASQEPWELLIHRGPFLDFTLSNLGQAAGVRSEYVTGYSVNIRALQSPASSGTPPLLYVAVSLNIFAFFA